MDPGQGWTVVWPTPPSVAHQHFTATVLLLGSFPITTDQLSISEISSPAPHAGFTGIQTYALLFIRVLGIQTQVFLLIQPGTRTH